MFIQIGNRIFNKAHIVSVEYRIGYQNVPMLMVGTDATAVGDYGTTSRDYQWKGDEATALWEQLQHYLAPTVIQIA